VFAVQNKSSGHRLPGAVAISVLLDLYLEYQYFLLLYRYDLLARWTGFFILAHRQCRYFQESSKWN